jgi:arylsulfatase A-like enzyme
MWNFINGDAPGGFRDAPGATEWNTWPQYFSTRGYYTAGAGKIYHKGDPSHFDPPSWTETECKTNFPHSPQGDCPIPKEMLPHPSPGCPVDTKVYTNCSTGEVDCFPDMTALDKGLDFLRKGVSQYKSSGQPFWLAFGFVKPHVPHIYPKEFLDLVPAMDDIDLPPNSNFTEGAPPICWLKEGPAKSIYEPTDPAKVRAFRQGYYAAAAYSDSLLGQLLDELETLGVADTTAVVMTADHGWGLGEHNHFLKYTNWETDARVPLVVRVPWKPATRGQRTSAIVEQIDMYPSLAELAGVPVDLGQESLDGRSWAHLFEDPSGEHKSAAYTQYPRCWPDDSNSSTAFTHMARCAGVERTDFAYMGYSVRTSQWRYTEWAKWNGKTLAPDWDKLAGVELYDHAADPPHDSKISFEQFENKNVVDDYPDVVKKLSKQLHEFVAKGTNSMEMII